MSLLARLLAFLLLAGLAAPAWADVQLSFYSRELGGNNFPHAFVRMSGTLTDGSAVDTAVGFTARSVTPAILLGSVTGDVIQETPGMIARSDRQFSVTVDEDRYRAVLAVVERWRTRTQPSYNLNRRNCVHFVGELAEAAGLRVDFAKGLMKRPRSFLQHVRSLNPLVESAPVAP